MNSRKTTRNKWDDPWFNNLSLGGKVLFLYLIDICDESGFANINIPVISAHTRISQESIRQHFIEISSKICVSEDKSVIWLINFMKHNDKLPLKFEVSRDIIVNVINKGSKINLFAKYLNSEYLNHYANEYGQTHFIEFKKVFDDCVLEYKRFKSDSENRNISNGRPVIISENQNESLRTIGNTTKNQNIKNPDLTEICDYVTTNFLELDYIHPQKFSEEFYNYYSSQGWLTASGMVVVDWKSKVNQWVDRRYQEYLKNKGNSVGKSNRTDLLMETDL